MEDVATQKDQLYGRDSLHETYYLVTHTHTVTQCYIHPPCTTAKSHLLSLSCAAQKTIGKKGIGTLSKKFKAPEITDQDRIRAAAEVKKNTIKGEIIGLWKRVKVGGGGGGGGIILISHYYLSSCVQAVLQCSVCVNSVAAIGIYLHVYYTQGVSSSEAQQEYMKILEDCSAYGSTFFEAEYTSKDQRFPRDLWLAINAKGVQIYQRGAVAPIQAYQYEK